MKNLFEPAVAEEVTARLANLRPDSPRLWGRMTAPQALAHCSASLEWAVGDRLPPRMFIGRIFGPLAKFALLRDEKPMGRNAPTDKSLRIGDQRELSVERERLRGLIQRFAAGGPAACTKHPHGFFGRLTPQEWAILMYKHLDHHFRQFSV